MSLQCAKLEDLSNQYFEITDASQTGLDFTGNLSVQIAFNAINFANEQDLFSKYKSTGNERSYIVRLNTSGDVYFYFSPDGNSGLTYFLFSNVFDTTEDIDNWVNFTLSLNLSAGTAFCRKNGVNITGVRTGTDTTIHNGSAKFRLGRLDGSTSRDINGKIANVKAWSTNLTEAECDADQASTTLVKTTNNELHVPLNGNSNDLSVNSNNLIAISSPVYKNDNNLSDITLYTKYQNVTIDNTKVDGTGGDVENYKVLIDLADLVKVGNDIFDTCRSDGQDIRVFKSDGVTQLPVEVVEIDTVAKTGILHVNFKGTLSSSVDTIVRVYYNGTALKRDDDALYGKRETWNDVFANVWHLAGSLEDACGNNDLTAYGGITSGNSTGKFGSATEFVNPTTTQDEYFQASSVLFDAKKNTFSCWVNSDLSEYRHIVSKHTSWVLNRTIMLSTDGDGNNEYAMYHYPYDQPYVRGSEADTGFVLLHGYTNMDNSRSSRLGLFEDGVLVDTGGSNNANIQTLTDTFNIGSRGTHSWDGDIHEVRRRKGSVPTTAWANTEYNNQSSPSTFYSPSDEIVDGPIASPFVTKVSIY